MEGTLTLHRFQHSFIHTEPDLWTLYEFFIYEKAEIRMIGRYTYQPDTCMPQSHWPIGF